LLPFGVTRALKRTEYSVPDERTRSLPKRSPDSSASEAVRNGRSVPKAAKPAGAAVKMPDGDVPNWQDSWSVRTVPAGNTPQQITR
jgi:hypothetical protein